MVISDVLPLPLPSSSNHCQKRVTTFKPQPLQPLDLVCSPIKSLNHGHELIDQTILSKTQPPEPASNAHTHAAKGSLRVKHAPHAPPCSTRTCHTESVPPGAPCIPRTKSSPCDAMLALRWRHQCALAFRVNNDVILPRHQSASAHVIPWPATVWTLT